jgi:hypothetical protein
MAVTELPLIEYSPLASTTDGLSRVPAENQDGTTIPQ